MKHQPNRTSTIDRLVRPITRFVALAIVACEGDTTGLGDSSVRDVVHADATPLDAEPMPDIGPPDLGVLPEEWAVVPCPASAIPLDPTLVAGNGPLQGVLTVFVARRPLESGLAGGQVILEQGQDRLEVRLPSPSDNHSQRTLPWRTRHAERETTRMKQFNVRDCIHIVALSDGPSWIHTVGLQQFGFPEIEIVGLPKFFYGAATSLLNDIADLMMNGERPVLEGDLIVLHPDERTVRLIASPAENDDPFYLDRKVWRIVDCEETCACEMCSIACAS